MASGSRLDYRILAQPYTVDDQEFIAVLHPVWTSAQIADVAHRVNIKDKFRGKSVWDSTLGEILFASGPLAADSWDRPGGTGTASTAELADVADPINTVGKYIGKLVYETTLDLLYASNGTAAASTWTLIDGLGLTTVTPS